MAVQTQIQARRGTAATWTSTNPTLAAGETGFETDTGKFKIGNGSTAWAALAYSAGATAVTYLFNATAGQTTFSGADANSLTLAYTVGAEQVYLNGVLQVRGSDYTATNGTSIVLASGALISDVLNVIAYSAMSITDTYTQAQANALFIPDAIVDAKGDLIAATANDTLARLAVGANDTVLTADSTAATGLKWAAAAPSGAFTLLSTTNITAAATISVTSINQTYKHLFVTVNNFRPLANNDIQLYLETSGAANISIGQTEVAFNGTSPLASTNLTGNSQGFLAKDVNSTSGVGTNSSSFWVYNYASTSLQKSITGSYGVYGVTNGNYRFATFGGSTYSAAGLGAVSTLKITTPSNTFAAQGTIQIYGVN